MTIRKYKNKSIESTGKLFEKQSGTANEDVKLICIHECNIPFVGAWKAGDKILDSKTIEKIGNNPNFIKEA